MKEKNINLFISVIGIVISIFAIIISMNANKISEKSYSLYKKEFLYDRTILLKSIKSTDYLTLVPTNDESTISFIKIIFPDKLNLSAIDKTYPDFKIYKSLFQQPLKKYLDSITPKVKDFALIRPHFSFPIIIITQGYSKGFPSLTFGIYSLQTSYIQTEGKSSIEIQGITFIDYTNQQNYKKDLNNIFIEREKILKKSYKKTISSTNDNKTLDDE